MPNDAGALAALRVSYDGMHKQWLTAHRAASFWRNNIDRLAYRYTDMRHDDSPVPVSVLRRLLVEEYQQQDIDPMDGAIERLHEALETGSADERDLALALNEAFRNGMQSGRGENKPPERVYIAISNLDAPRDLGAPGGDRSPLWMAHKGGGSDGTGSEPIYRIQGDPNAVAVGRFKASLRKFIGCSCG